MSYKKNLSRLKIQAILFFIIPIILFGCLKAKKSPFDISSPSGLLISGIATNLSESQVSPAPITPTSTIAPTVNLSKSSYLYFIGDAVNIIPTFTASNPTFSIVPNLPSGLSLDTSSGKITGAVSVSFPKTNYELTVTDSGGSTKASLSLKISGNTAQAVMGQSSFTVNPINSGGAISSSGLNAPSAIAIDSADGIYILENVNNRVLYFPAGASQATRVYGQLGSFTSGASNNGGITANSLNNPQGIAIDSSNGIYIADYGNSRVLHYPSGSTTADRVYGQLGNFTVNTQNNGGITANSLSNPNTVSVDSANGLYISDYVNSRVLYYPSGSTTATRVYGQFGSFTSGTLNNGGISANSLLLPYNVTAANSGLYIADTSNHRILYFAGTSTTATRVYGQGGSFTTNSANNGGISANSLNQPGQITIDSTNGIYISDIPNHRVLYFSADFTIAIRVYGQGAVFTTNQANKGGISADSLNSPGGVGINSSGEIYIVDTSNNRILIY